MMVDLII